MNAAARTPPTLAPIIMNVVDFDVPEDALLFASVVEEGVGVDVVEMDDAIVEDEDVTGVGEDVFIMLEGVTDALDVVGMATAEDDVCKTAVVDNGNASDVNAAVVGATLSTALVVWTSADDVSATAAEVLAASADGVVTTTVERASNVVAASATVALVTCAAAAAPVFATFAAAAAAVGCAAAAAAAAAVATPAFGLFCATAAVATPAIGLFCAAGNAYTVGSNSSNNKCIPCPSINKMQSFNASVITYHTPVQ